MAASLVAPEAQLLNSPFIVGYLNGMASLVDYGLTNVVGGFGEPYKRDYSYDAAPCELVFAHLKLGELNIQQQATGKKCKYDLAYQNY